MAKKAKKNQKYRIYPMHSAQIKRTLDKQSREFKPMGKWESLQRIFKHQPVLQNTTTANIHVAELQWESQGRNALFLNLDDIRTIERGCCKVKFVPDNFLPFKSFMLCLPAGYEAHGIRPTGLLITSFDSQKERVQNINNCRLKIDPESPVVLDNAIKYQGKGISIAYRGTHEKEFTTLDLYGEDLESMVNSKTFSDFVTVYEKMSGHAVNYFSQSPLTTSERQLQYTLFKLVMSLSMYIKAKPDVLTEGFPVKGGFSLSEPFSEPVRSLTINVSSKHRDSPEEHHRGWFIRQLVAECYYRGEYKDLEPGSRMVFVDETPVHLKVASHNVQG